MFDSKYSGIIDSSNSSISNSTRLRFHGCMKLVLASLIAVIGFAAHAAAAPEIIKLWPNGAPNAVAPAGEEKDTTGPKGGMVAGKSVIRLGNVSQPTLTLYRAPKESNTGACVVVCPGGGYNILAWDLEGTEICEWFNSIGVNAALLKYRVPKAPGAEKHAAPLQDAQRAIGLLRHRATEWAIDAKRIGILGFSAGGHLSAVACNNHDKRTYPATDDADKASCRPDFALLIYPAYLTVKEKGDVISPELPLNAQTPPTFIVMTQDDGVRVESALFYYLALKQAKVSAELHLYPTGGHGDGLRSSAHMVTRWPQRAEEWLRATGLLAEKK